MPRRTDWPAEAASEDRGGPTPSRAGEGPPPSPQDPVERARAICLRLLTGTPRTRRELADALRARGVPAEASAAVLDRFEEVGLIDDAAFAEAWVESRHRGRGLAGRALARELRSKGVDDAHVAEALGQLDADQEEETARAVAERKLRATRGQPWERRLRRTVGVLARKGYAESLALRVVRQALEAEGADPEAVERYLPE